MDTKSKRGHLYASKVMASAFLLVLVIALLATYAPVLMIYGIIFVICVSVFASLYKILYDIGRDK